MSQRLQQERPSVQKPYHVRVDPAARLLTISLRDFWTVDILDRFEAELLAAIATLDRVGAGQQGFVTLADIRDFPVQSQEVAQRLRFITEQFGAKSRRIANLLSGAALQQMQARRIAAEDISREFTDEAKALAWLKAA